MAVMAHKMNVLYVGFDNPLHVVVSDVPDERLVLIPSAGTIRHDSAGAYTWRLCTFESAEARLVLADSGENQPIDTLSFRVKRLPEPDFFVRGRSIGWLFQEGEGLLNEFRLLSFEAEFILKGADAVVFTNYGHRFNEDVVSYMYRLYPGCEFTLYNFRYSVGCDPTVIRSGQVLHRVLR